MDLYVENDQSLVTLSEASIKPIVEAVLFIENESADEVSISFLEPEAICSIHEEHFNDPSHTDCMSFPMDEKGSNPRNLGQAVISPKAAIDHVNAHGGDVYEELTLYLVHCLLHLLGYRDGNEQEKREMRLAEKRSMDYLVRERALIKP